MFYVETILFLVGVAALVFGYRKNRRNVLLLAAVLLFLVGAAGDFSHGFVDGFRHGWSATHGTSATR